MESEELREIVKNIIIKQGLVKEGDLVLVGVSGGADSMCLLHVLLCLSKKMGFSVEAAHVNHMLRGLEADGDEEYVRDICNKWGIRLSIYRRDVKELMAEEGLSLEEAARKARYDAFHTCAGDTGADKIAVAHNRGDQAETVIMNIIRGTGLEGLTGMDYANGMIIRPFLNIDRQDIERYCKENGICPRTDSSNLNEVFTRNTIRNRLIPFMEELFGFNPVESISRMAILVREDAKYLNKEASRLFKAVCNVKSEAGKKHIEVNIDALTSSPDALASRVVRMAVRHLEDGLSGVRKVHVDDVLSMARCGRNGSVIQLPRGIRVRKEYGILIFYLEHEQEKPYGFQKELKIPGVTHIRELGLDYETEILDANDVYSIINGHSGDDLTQFFDYDSLSSGMNVRNRRDGDVFMPVNSRGRRKLKEYFIDRKIPRSERDKIPVVSAGNDIVWITGYNINDKFKVTENTKTVLRIKCLGYRRFPGNISHTCAKRGNTGKNE